MTEHYLDRLARTINENWDQPALTDFYLTEDGSTQDTSRGNHYTYGEMYVEILRLGKMLTALGIKKSDHIAICGANSAHWAIAYLAIAAYQGVSVTVMQGQSREDIAHQIDFSDAKVLFVDAELWRELQSLPIPQIEHVVGLEDWSILRGKEIQFPNQKSLIVTQKACFSHGNLDELAHICFTSGTTGESKGVMMSFGNISSTIKCVKAAYPPKRDKKILSYFPMAHAFGLGLEIMVPITSGCNIYVYRDELQMPKLVKAMLCVKPYLLLMVPMMLTRIAEKSLLRLLLLHLIRMKYIVIGGAELPYRVAKFMKRMRIPIAPGYGMTETIALISLCTPSTYRVGSSGKICDALSCCIAPNGEILVKGENVMLGYYKDPEATARKIDKDGWLHTGDKGHLDEDGYLYVEGRLNQDMIVLPNGENIHPEDIERKINALPEVKESLVLARDGKLVAIVVPQITNLQSPMTNTDLRRMILRNVNPLLPLYSQLYDVEISDTPLQKTEKQTIKRYLYK